MQEYRFKFYLNAIHSIIINEVMGQEHPHTWEIGIDAFKSDDSFVMFTEIEKAVDQVLKPFQDKNMNQVSPFDVVNPTLENVSFYFKSKIEKLLLDHDWMLTRLEVSETPTRTFVIDLKNPSHINQLRGNKQEVLFKTVEEEATKIMNTKQVIEDSTTGAKAPVPKAVKSKKKKKAPKNDKYWFDLILAISFGLIAYAVYFILKYNGIIK